MSHTPTGAAAPDFIFCALLPAGQRHLPATRVGEPHNCPHPCAATCPLQLGACITLPLRPRRLALSLCLGATLQQLLKGKNLPATGCLISRN